MGQHFVQHRDPDVAVTAASGLGLAYMSVSGLSNPDVSTE